MTLRVELIGEAPIELGPGEKLELPFLPSDVRIHRAVAILESKPAGQGGFLSVSEDDTSPHDSSGRRHIASPAGIPIPGNGSPLSLPGALGRAIGY